LEAIIKFPLKIKRIYDIPSAQDGFRILVDRLWARGITKERAALDYWYKDIAPSSDLRKWFAHKPENFTEFSKMYTEELKLKCETIKEIKELAGQKPVTLLYAAKDPKINHAVVLQNFVMHSNC
jgi:uncharacterized protein YeaO (DUF488 family)